MLTQDTNVQYSLFHNDNAIVDSATVTSLSLTNGTIYEYIKVHSKSDTLRSEDIGQLYEAELAKADKVQKKQRGQYYTPSDVARVMSEWLERLAGRNVCDVACGTGNLIMAYLDYIGWEQAIELLQSGRLYLYDADGAALEICKVAITAKYGEDAGKRLHVIYADFLSSNISLPADCKVIANPPYCAISGAGDDWDNTDVLRDTKECMRYSWKRSLSKACRPSS